MLSDIEHLQSIMADIIKQTASPTNLPLAGEELLREFRLSDHHDDQVLFTCLIYVFIYLLDTFICYIRIGSRERLLSITEA